MNLKLSAISTLLEYVCPSEVYWTFLILNLPTGIKWLAIVTSIAIQNKITNVSGIWIFFDILHR
ncbi:hypothetical protein CDV26_02500 [Francisella halioticida]|uniref:Uncharacterized protein n=1 Tax=Francisella halioticida TaxID=549298 RepID=A0ABN5AZ26_9GAMM|nr:hypothetical protein CDV26_02500 [Francisella halioticida]